MLSSASVDAERDYNRYCTINPPKTKMYKGCARARMRGTRARTREEHSLPSVARGLPCGAGN